MASDYHTNMKIMKYHISRSVALKRAAQRGLVRVNMCFFVSLRDLRNFLVSLSCADDKNSKYTHTHSCAEMFSIKLFSLDSTFCAWKKISSNFSACAVRGRKNVNFFQHFSSLLKLGETRTFLPIFLLLYFNLFWLLFETNFGIHSYVFFFVAT